MTLLDEARVALDAVTAAVERTRRAGQPERRLTVAMKPAGDAGLLPDILKLYEVDPLAIPVEVVYGFDRRAHLLRQGAADVALLHSPGNDLSGLATQALLVEDQIAVLPRDHPLATAPSVGMSDLRDGDTPLWPDAALQVSDVSQLMQMIALGHALAVVPASVTGHLRHDLVSVPVLDAVQTTLVLAWPEHSTLPALAAFVRGATELAASTACRHASRLLPTTRAKHDHTQRHHQRHPSPS